MNRKSGLFGPTMLLTGHDGEAPLDRVSSRGSNRTTTAAVAARTTFTAAPKRIPSPDTSQPNSQLMGFVCR